MLASFAAARVALAPLQDPVIESEAVRIAREILADAGYQTTLPGEGSGEGPDFGWLEGFLAPLGWLFVGVACVGIVIALVAWLRGRSGLEVGPMRVEEGAGAEPLRFPASALGEAEALAREGRFGEAIRLLLHLTFEALRGRQGVRLEPWLTGREIVREARVPDAVRASLGALVGAVELSLFAGREPGRTDFERCMEEYRALLASAQRSAA